VNETPKGANRTRNLLMLGALIMGNLAHEQALGLITAFVILLAYAFSKEETP